VVQVQILVIARVLQVVRGFRVVQVRRAGRVGQQGQALQLKLVRQPFKILIYNF
jgi:hypothetical protein